MISIFNDVIGPVMRGASSSHCAAALRIGRLARDLMDADIRHVLIEFDTGGSLPNTHTSQGSDMGLFGGLLGWDAADERLPDSARHLREAGVAVEFRYAPLDDPHPNTYRLTLSSARETHTMIAISTGGGMIEVLEVDGARVSGDSGSHGVLDGGAAVTIGGRTLRPVLPVLTWPDSRVPFRSAAELAHAADGSDRALSEWAIDYECARGRLSRDEVQAKMLEIVHIWQRSIAQGLAGTHYDDRLLGQQSHLFDRAMQTGRLLDAGALNRAVLYVTALMEVKSSMGVIVAAPTAGACAALPGAVLAFAEAMHKRENDMARAFLAAGLIGVFIADRWTFAAEVGGCQAEGGSAAAMAAGALVTLAGGSTTQALAAASLALQSMLGLICDPVAARVEIPCLGKNVIAASNAVSCANMALAGFDPMIPFDEVVDAARRVADAMPREHRCTALGGLATTPTALKLAGRLADKVKIKANMEE